MGPFEKLPPKERAWLIPLDSSGGEHNYALTALGTLTITMQIIELDAGSWMTPLDFVLALKAALGAPDWHGDRAVAFVDSMVAGGINTLRPPYIIRVVNAAELTPEVMALVRQVSSYVEETRVRRLARTGENVEVHLEITN